MRNYKLSEIKARVSLGLAEDISNIVLTKEDYKDYDCLGLSFGKYGMNGGLFIRHSDHKICAITKRNSNLFILA